MYPRVSAGLFTTASEDDNLVAVVVAEQIVAENGDLLAFGLFAIEHVGPRPEGGVHERDDDDSGVDERIAVGRGVGDHVREVDLVGHDVEAARELSQMARAAMCVEKISVGVDLSAVVAPFARGRVVVVAARCVRFDPEVAGKQWKRCWRVGTGGGGGGGQKWRTGWSIRRGIRR